MWARNSGWMFFASWTSKPQVCLSDPSFNHASGLPTTNEKQAVSAERKSRFVAPACKCIHCSWWESCYNVYRISEPLAEIQTGTVVLWCDSHPKQILTGEFREFTEDHTLEPWKRIFLALKKARAAQTGTRDVGDTIVVRTTVGTVKSH